MFGNITMDCLILLHRFALQRRNASDVLSRRTVHIRLKELKSVKRSVGSLLTLAWDCTPAKVENSKRIPDLCSLDCRVPISRTNPPDSVTFLPILNCDA